MEPIEDIESSMRALFQINSSST